MERRRDALPITLADDSAVAAAARMAARRERAAEADLVRTGRQLVNVD
jgi:hypothetical protein